MISGCYYSANLILHRMIGTEIVTLYVGPDKKPFPVHKLILCQASKFFDKAFNSEFKEAIEGAMTLPEDRTQHFEIFVEWLYQGEEFQLDALADIWGVEGGDSPEAVIHDLLDLYVFADKYNYLRLQNIAMDGIQDLHDDENGAEFTQEWAKEVFDKTAHIESTPLRTFCAAQLHRHAITTGWWECNNQGSGSEILARFFRETPGALLPYLRFQKIVTDDIVYITADPEVRTTEEDPDYHLCFFHVHDPSHTAEDCTSNPAPRHQRLLSGSEDI